MRNVVSAQKDGVLRVWDPNTGKLLRTLQGRTPRISSGSMTPDGKRLVCGSYDKKVVVWDLAAGKEIQSFNTQDDVWHVAICSDGARIASGGPDGLIRIWEVSGGN